MAKNRYQHRGRKIALNVADVNGSGTANKVLSGDPGAVGQLPFVALTDEGTDGIATCDTLGVYNLSVNPAADLAQGDLVYWDNSAGELNDDDSGVRFGYVTEDLAYVDAPATVHVRVGY